MYLFKDDQQWDSIKGKISFMPFQLDKHIIHNWWGSYLEHYRVISRK